MQPTVHVCHAFAYRSRLPGNLKLFIGYVRLSKIPKKMSFKSCFVLLPGLIKTLKPSTITNLNRSFLNVVKKPQQIAFLSTDRKFEPKTSKELKEIYYGILTPQIKAVKVRKAPPEYIFYKLVVSGVFTVF